MRARHGSVAAVGEESAGNRPDVPFGAREQSREIFSWEIGGPETFLENHCSFEYEELRHTPTLQSEGRGGLG
jgi:hypothetical protein